MTNPYNSRWIKAKGALVKTEHGVKIDFSSGIFSSNLGHGNPAVKKAIIGQLNQGFTNTYRHPTAIRDKYIERLLTFSGAKSAWLFSTGAEASEAALRMLRLVGGGQPCKLENGFHGKTGGVNKLDIFHPDIMLESLILEPYRPYDAAWHGNDFIQRVRQGFECIIFDEIQSGFYRTGSRFAFTQYQDFQPDIVVLGKAIANGFPLSAVLVYNGFLSGCAMSAPGEFTSTYGGNPVACAAGLAVLEEMQGWKGLPFLEMFDEFLLHCNGRGYCRAISVNNEKLFVSECFDRGVIVIPTGKGWVKLAPPLTIREKYLKAGLLVIREVYDGMLGA